MIKYFFFIILVFFSGNLSAQFSVVIKWQQVNPDVKNDSIYYNARKKLVWNDFMGKPVAASPAIAITESGFGYKMSMNSYNRKTEVEIIVFCYFNKQNSWVKPDMGSDYALEHEQHHFDITYINTVLFIQKLKQAQLNRSNFNYLVEKIHDECFAALNKMQDDYDGQTSNGRIKNMQYIWNNKINKQLASIATN